MIKTESAPTLSRDVSMPRVTPPASAADRIPDLDVAAFPADPSPAEPGAIAGLPDAAALGDMATQAGVAALLTAGVVAIYRKAFDLAFGKS